MKQGAKRQALKPLSRASNSPAVSSQESENKREPAKPRLSAAAASNVKRPRTSGVSEGSGGDPKPSKPPPPQQRQRQQQHAVRRSRRLSGAQQTGEPAPRSGSSSSSATVRQADAADDDESSATTTVTAPLKPCSAEAAADDFLSGLESIANSQRGSGSSGEDNGGEESLASQLSKDETQQRVADLQDAFAAHEELSQSVYAKCVTEDYLGTFNRCYGAQYQHWLRTQEANLKFRPTAYLTQVQRDLRAVMRSTLIDWLVEVCTEFRLQPGTPFLVIELLDRSLSAFCVNRDNLQLLGCACLLVAAKFEEEHPPSVNSLVYISDSAYTISDMVRMEGQVLQHLNFAVSCVTPHHFAAEFSAAAGCNARQGYLCLYLLELALLDYSLVSLLPSHKAAAAALLARMTMRRGGGAWSALARQFTGYSAATLEPCVRRMRVLHESAENSKLHAIRDRYCKQERHRVALVCCLKESELVFT
ncbi:cyclin-like protein [Tribonema minus]|uniref:Cyclin-like protein n=1 Tax=Tribonema minus TaxID=303371 RepID=A0A835YJW4_9STRA|nr:cyclin-like protein [Tribonema minus]